MLERYAKPVLDALTADGVFDTTPEHLVNRTLSILEGLMIADRNADRIATDREVEDILTVMEAEQTQFEKLVRDVRESVSDALFYLRDVKTMSHIEPDVAQKFRDQIWRTSDLAQVRLENLLSQVSQEELNAWHDVR